MKKDHMSYKIEQSQGVDAVSVGIAMLQTLMRLCVGRC